MALFVSKMAPSPMTVPELVAFGTVTTPPHLKFLRKVGPEVAKLQKDRNQQSDRLLAETAQVRESVHGVAVNTAPPLMRGKSAGEVIYRGAADLGAISGRWAASLPGYLPGQIDPRVEVMTYMDKNSLMSAIGHINEALVYSSILRWTYDTAYYCAQTGRPVAALVPALHIKLSAELVKMFGPEVDTRHLNGVSI